MAKLLVVEVLSNLAALVTWELTALSFLVVVVVCSGLPKFLLLLLLSSCLTGAQSSCRFCSLEKK